MKTVLTKRKLKGFVSPDTSSQYEGYVEAGRYSLIELRENFPDADTDYAQISAPLLGDNDTWLCIRWKQQQYGSIQNYQPPKPAPLVPQDDYLTESLLIDELKDFHRFTYHPNKARYPNSLKNTTVPLAPPYTNNCCTFVEALIVQTWQRQLPSFNWDQSRHRQMMIMSREDYFSPVTALVESDIALFVPDSDTLPLPWTVIQGWRDKWSGGHSFMIIDYDENTDKVLTLECNSAYKLNGVGFRGIGNLRDFSGKPPTDWMTIDDVWTWEEIMSTYRYREQATLKVKDYLWSKEH